MSCLGTVPLGPQAAALVRTAAGSSLLLHQILISTETPSSLQQEWDVGSSAPPMRRRCERWMLLELQMFLSGESPFSLCTSLSLEESSMSIRTTVLGQWDSSFPRGRGSVSTTHPSSAPLYFRAGDSLGENRLGAQKDFNQSLKLFLSVRKNVGSLSFNLLPWSSPVPEDKG